ncbi:metal-dependent hydrolase [Agromyces sp. H3Y2-19a]|uniref:metal-dependent hydrolase n=1 Tax=Agromyces chromiiresistens TaxID=3030835 RepID=UPI0023B94947|nr:metal-dependent hydrolase [Agromyces chromiiresistens]MDF0512834.1 metal-dependent hydrolase [Agromyces chromiiresistens]
MTLPAHDTIVTYPAGELVRHATVLHTAPARDGLVAVVTDATSFHPVDAAWPDQPADTGTLRAGDRELPIRDAVVAATDGSELHVGDDVPVRKGTEGWAFVVAHLMDGGGPVAEGDQVVITADASARRALSLGHSACHAASLALNRAVESRWSKPARTDALGRPDFDGIAITSSRIEPFGSVDRYRLNKSLRRAGFDATGLAEALDELGREVSAAVGEWVAAGSTVRVERDGDRLTDRRSWVAELPEGVARIACGGTHVDSLAELGAVRVAFELVDDAGTPVLEMRTRVGADG